MEGRGMKRKRFAELKKELSVELHKLTLASGDFNNDLHNANRDFEGMLRKMAEKQSEFLSRSVVIEEQYWEAIECLKGGGQVTTNLESGATVDLPRGYAENVRKFANDVKTSLLGHEEFQTEENEDMEKIFKKYEEIFGNNLKEMRNKAETIVKQRSKLGTKLFQFISTVEESDEKEDDDDGEESDGGEDGGASGEEA